MSKKLKPFAVHVSRMAISYN